MLVVCPCGKKLNVADALVGKKVRCPACKDAFLVNGSATEKKTSPGIPKKSSKAHSDEEVPSQQRQLLASKPRKAKRVEEDDFLEDYEEEDRRSSAKKRKARPGNGSSSGLIRTIIGAVVLGIVLIGLGVVWWLRLNEPSTVTLEVNVGNPTVFVDGKEVKLEGSSARSGTVSLTLSPGDHEIKVTKDKFQPYQKQVSVSSKSDNHIDIKLLAIMPAPPSGNYKPPADSLIVTAETVILDVETNWLAAKNKYTGRPMVVSGEVAYTIPLSQQIPVHEVGLRGTQERGAKIRWLFDFPLPETASQIKIGQKLKVSGKCDSVDQKGVTLTAVRLLEP